MLQDIKEVLFSEEVINNKIKELATRISEDYKGKNLLVVGVLKGSVIFAAELIKNISIPCEIDFMAVSSYGTSSETTGVVRILKDLDHEISGKDIIICVQDGQPYLPPGLYSYYGLCRRYYLLAILSLKFPA